MDELIFKYIELRPSLTAPIRALQRGKDGAQILLRNESGQWVLASKPKHYYHGVYKMFGGGIKSGEDPQAAAQRELAEETGIQVDGDKLVPLIHAEVFYDRGGEYLNFSSFVFYCQSGRSVVPADDVEDVATLSDHEFGQLVERLADLPTTAMSPEEQATWADYGKVWGPIHQAALERVKELGL
jgi:8-oxo-dGTP pyrophosphatase MutT (NUDIX family)